MYNAYYDVVKLTTLPPDPRIKARARCRALGTALLGVIFALWLGTIATAAALDWRFGANPIEQVLIPWNVLGWTVNYNFLQTYPNAGFDAYIHRGFDMGYGAIAVGIVLTVLWTILDYRKTSTQLAAFPNEGRDARWATPEELFAPGPTESLFPEGYDLHRGFTSADRLRSRKQRARASVDLSQRRRAANGVPNA